MAVTVPGTVNVEWNYAITATMTMHTQTTASDTHTVPAANDIFTQANGGSGQCNGSAGSTEDPGVDLNVNFGLVVADSTDYTNCLEKNAIDAYIVTNDSLGYTLTVEATSGAPSAYDTATNGSLLCVLPANTWSTTGNTAWASSARVAAVSMTSTTACSSGQAILTSAATTLVNDTKATTGSDINQDLQLNMGPQMQSGSQNVTLTYTLTTN